MVSSAFGFQIDEIETEFPNPNGTSEFLHDQEPLAEVAPAGEQIFFVEHVQ